jgi:molybdopterin-synthase adenylyltransferase
MSSPNRQNSADASHAANAMENIERYSRHAELLGDGGLDAVLRASVCVVGAGGLGSTVLQLLSRLGVGRLIVFETGTLDLPDLNRQILYTPDDIGRPKASAAASALKRINPDIRVEFRTERFCKTTRLERVACVVDCTDNFESRLAMEPVCLENGIPVLHGGITGYFGQVTSFLPGHRPTISGVFHQTAVDQDEIPSKPVFPPAVLIVASIQVAEVVKLLTGRQSEMLSGRMLSIDLVHYAFDILKLRG